MIKIKTSLKDVIIDTDSFFSIYTVNDGFTDKDLELIQLIDNADIDNDKILTPFGVGGLEDLSTGCKTLLNCIHYTEKVFYVGCCGENVLSYVINNLDITVALDYEASCSIADVTEMNIDGDIYVGNSGYMKFWGDFYKKERYFDI